MSAEVDPRLRAISDMVREGVHGLAEQIQAIVRMGLAAGLGHFRVWMVRPHEAPDKAMVTIVFSGPCSDGDLNRLSEFLKAWHQDVSAGGLEVTRIEKTNFKLEDHDL